MFAYSRLAFRMIALCVLTAGTLMLLKPLKAEAFACPGGAHCSQQYSSCLAKCGTNTICKQQCLDGLEACCNL